MFKFSNSVIGDNNLPSLEIRPDVKPDHLSDGQDILSLFQDETLNT
jgi:hypothetical protein